MDSNGFADFGREYMDDKEKIRTIYNQDVSQLEFELKRSQQWTNRVLKKLKQAEAYTIKPFLERSGMEQYRTLKRMQRLERRTSVD